MIARSLEKHYKLMWQFKNAYCDVMQQVNIQFSGGACHLKANTDTPPSSLYKHQSTHAPVLICGLKLSKQTGIYDFTEGNDGVECPQFHVCLHCLNRWKSRQYGRYCILCVTSCGRHISYVCKCFFKLTREKVVSAKVNVWEAIWFEWLHHQANEAEIN